MRIINVSQCMMSWAVGWYFKRFIWRLQFIMTRTNARAGCCAGATFDLLDDRSFEQFAQLPEHAWASLNEQDRHTIQQRVSEWEG